MKDNVKYIVVSTERSGSSMTSAILANAGADFGFEKNREWYRGAGDYEHKEVVDTYKYLKRVLLFQKFSDRLTLKMKKKIVSKMEALYSKVSFSKYPPLSQYLPFYVKQAGFDIRLIVVIREFNDYSISMISKNGKDFETLKETYLSTYRTSLLNLSLYGGCIICYEHITNRENIQWAELVEKTCGLDASKLIAERDKVVKPTFLRNKIQNTVLDKECDDLYKIYKDLSDTLYEPSYVKQHVSKTGKKNKLSMKNEKI